ncbi:MAG: 50S ribosomal protein L22 [Parcubacteria group bacterium]|nr:50S ribosomal protein L22 [Parcubacteria group bacterium]
MAEVKAQAKFQRIAPRKVRLVVGLLKNLSIAEAQNQLKSLPKRSAGTVLKVLNSAVANAKNNNKMNVDDLVVTRAFVDGGPTLKRWMPRAFGRASQIMKRTSHITIMVGEKKKLK